MEKRTVSYSSGNGFVNITVPTPKNEYVNEFINSRSIVPMSALFRLAGDPVKEWTESYAALKHLKKWHGISRKVLHVGDGAHCRTGALFAYHTWHDNVSIDPQMNEDVHMDWTIEVGGVDRLSGKKMKFEEYVTETKAVVQNRPPGTPGMLLTFVHAHVNTEQALASLPHGSWDAAFTLSCCEPLAQLVPKDSQVARIVKEGDDWNVLSPERHFQVLVPR